MQSLQPFLSWLLQQELVGQIPMLELDLEEASDLAEEQRQHRDPGADRWRRQADLPVGPLG